jgi:methylenetetrahydrofolate dehydrogenase (NADP+) / methenyltetrahydrofolate cyclohydrolase
MEKLLTASPIVSSLKIKLKEDIDKLLKQNIVPKLAVVLVGDNAASKIYVMNKKKLCEQVGAECKVFSLSKDIDQVQFLNTIKGIVNDVSNNGIIIQLPLPEQLKSIDISSLIPPNKDVDGFNPLNLGMLIRDNKEDHCLIPCTPKGILKIFNFYNINLTAKKVLIIGRSLIVGKPLSVLLTNQNATVTLAHSKSKNVEELSKSSDIIISCVGKNNLINSTFLNDSTEQIFIDVGINRTPSAFTCKIRNKTYRITGDINFEEVYPLAKMITPVPGGVGPLTVLSLVENLVQATKQQSISK